MRIPRSLLVQLVVCGAIASSAGVATSCRLVAGVESVDGCTSACVDERSRRLCLDEERPRIEQCSADAPYCIATGANPTCVQCTSDDQCTATPGEDELCTRTRCVSNSCVPGVLVAKATCGKDHAGICNEAGVCMGSDIVLSALRRHACLRTHDSKVYCWGDNTFGELGDGTRDPRGRPVRVKALPPARNVVAGYAHTCAIVEDGSVYCWGNNSAAQIGDGSGPTEQPILKPTRVVDLPPAKELAVGQGHGCILTPNEEVWCWGYNDFGQAGQPTTSRVVPRALKHSALTKGGAHVQANKNHTCMLQNAKPTLACWGDNNHAQLARDPGTLPSSAMPVEITIPGEGEPVSIALGFESTCAVVPPDGHTYCWGYDKRAQLGNGTAVDGYFVTPQKVLADDPVTGERSAALLGSLEPFRTDGSHACVRTNLQRYGSFFLCWGADDAGELGLGEFYSKEGATEADKLRLIATPTKVVPPGTITMAHGEDFACLVVAAESEPPSIQCYGYEDLLGVGTVVAEGSRGPAQRTPRPVVWDPASL